MVMWRGRVFLKGLKFVSLTTSAKWLVKLKKSVPLRTFFFYFILMVGTFCMTTRDLLHDKQGALTELTCPKTSSTPNNSYHVRTYDKCSFLSVTLV